MVILDVNVLGAGLHARGLGKLDRAIVIFEGRAMDNGFIPGKVRDLLLEFLKEAEKNESSAKGLRQTNVFGLRCAQSNF